MKFREAWEMMERGEVAKTTTSSSDFYRLTGGVFEWSPDCVKWQKGSGLLERQLISEWMVVLKCGNPCSFLECRGRCSHFVGVGHPNAHGHGDHAWALDYHAAWEKTAQLPLSEGSDDGVTWIVVAEDGGPVRFRYFRRTNVTGERWGGEMQRMATDLTDTRAKLATAERRLAEWDQIWKDDQRRWMAETARIKDGLNQAEVLLRETRDNEARSDRRGDALAADVAYWKKRAAELREARDRAILGDAAYDRIAKAT